MNNKTVSRLRLNTLPGFAAASMISSAAFAHDFWIQPSAFQSPVDTAVKVELRVGDGFPGDIVARNDSRIEKFIVANSTTAPASVAEGEKPLIGRDGDRLSGVFHPEKPGLHIIAFRGKPSFIKLEAEKFESYLKEEGLDDIIAWRKEHGETAKDGTEIYSRCAKSLVQAGEASEGQVDRELGLRLELIAQANPALLKPGDELQVQMLFDGKPLANRTIIAKCAEHAEAKVSAKTDDKGMAKLKLAQPGMWLITSVLMTEAPKENDKGAQWESLWASLTLQVSYTRTK